MKKVLFLPFLFLLVACVREPKDVDLFPPSNGIPKTSNIGTDSIADPIKIEKVKVYIENTRSMYGYLPFQGRNGKTTDFRNAVNELLRASKNTYSKEKVELSLINNTTTISVNINNNLDAIDERVLPNKYSKGSGSSDFDKLFKKIINGWNEEEVIVLIADFIYSPRGRDPISGLDNFRGEISDAFQNTSGGESIAVNILHLESDFYGKYYDIDDVEKEGIKNRPYYIFIMGNETNVKKYSEKVVSQLKRYNLKNEYNLSSRSTQINDYSALPYTLKLGQFAPKSSNQNTSQVRAVTVKNALNHNTNVELAVAVDLQDIPVSKEYLMDINNYNFNDGRIKLIDVGTISNGIILLSNGTENVIKSHDIDKAKNASHVFLISFPSTYKGVAQLSLNKSIPKWINDVSIKNGEDDRDIQTNILKQSQTFGFNYIVEGIYEAQLHKNPENLYFDITVEIGQEKAGSGIGTIVGWLIALAIIGIIVIIILRNKRRK